MKKLVVKQFVSAGSSRKSYDVVGLEDTVEWNINDVLSKQDLESIIRRNGTHKVKVVIK